MVLNCLALIEKYAVDSTVHLKIRDEMGSGEYSMLIDSPVCGACVYMLTLVVLLCVSKVTFVADLVPCTSDFENVRVVLLVVMCVM